MSTEPKRQCPTDDHHQLEHVSILAGVAAKINSDEFWRGSPALHHGLQDDLTRTSDRPGGGRDLNASRLAKEPSLTDSNNLYCDATVGGENVARKDGEVLKTPLGDGILEPDRLGIG